jgi:myosin heavy subunit
VPPLNLSVLTIILILFILFQEVTDLVRILAAILHLANIEFEQNEFDDTRLSLSERGEKHLEEGKHL